MNAAAWTTNPLTTDIDDRPPWLDDMTNQGNHVLCEEAGPSQAPHQPKHHQLHITEDLTSDELCEPSHNSSIHSTTALSGGLRYRPTTSMSFSSNLGSFESLKVLTRCGFSPRDDQTRCTVAGLTPTALAMDRQLQCVSPSRLLSWVS